MNTAYIRKRSIAKILGSLLENTCIYSPETKARYDLMEPDFDALRDFRLKLSNLAELHFHNKLDIEDVEEVYNWCYRIGASVGHVLSHGTTGTWGVRLSHLNDIVKALEIPDFDLLPRGSIIDMYGHSVEIVDYYKVSETWIVVKFRNTNEYHHEWEGCVSWKDLNILKEN